MHPRSLESDRYANTVDIEETPTTVPYSFYLFLSAPKLSHMDCVDAAFLGRKGVLELPNKVLLRVLLEHYFLHVHLTMPFLSECSFWDMFNAGRGTFSLLLLRSMLFAASSVSSFLHMVPDDAIILLPYPVPLP